MEESIDLSRTLRFLANLADHNERVWFEAHRNDYEAAREQFARVVGAVIRRFGSEAGFADLSPRECIMRIYRDIRFSRDKTPYRTGMGASFSPGGRKAEGVGYHLSIQPGDHSIVAGGLYMPSATQLTGFRNALLDDAAEFRKIISAKRFISAFGGIAGESLKTAPKGVPKDHPDIDLLRLKQVYVSSSLSDGAVAATDFPGEVVRRFRAMKPFIDFLRAAVE